MKAINQANPANVVEFALTKMKNLPKRGIGDVLVTVDGKITTCKVTSNAAWCAGKDFLEYIWFTIKDVPYYLTLDYNVRAGDVSESMDLKIEAGTASRKNPIRGPEMVLTAAETEGVRIEKFKATWAKKATA